MAEIKVEKKGSPWWLWVLGAVLVLALLMWLLGNNDRVGDREVAEAPMTTPRTTPYMDEPTESAAGPITDLATLANVDAQAAGRTVQLERVRVLNVVGDRTFYVGENDAQRVFVVLNQAPTPGTPTEGRYNVQAGQMLNVNGVVRRPDDPAFAGQPIEGLPAGARTVVHAQSLDIVDGS